MGQVAAIIAVLLIAGCQSIPKGSFCDIAKPLRPTEQTIAPMSDAEVREVLAHNRRASVCVDGSHETRPAPARPRRR
jgi:hypothetical protein